MPNKTTYATIIVIFLACVSVSALTVSYSLGYLDSGSHSKNNSFVVIDMMKVKIAQRNHMSSMLGEEVTPSKLSEAFRASGDVKETASKIAGDRDVMVKQSFLDTDAPDITNKVLDELDIPHKNISEEEVNDFMSQKDGVPERIKEYSKNHKDSIQNKRSISPYE